MPDFSRLDEIWARRPLIHCVSNIVSANDCANLALAVGASPMMAHAAEEMEDITAISSATVLNTGTPDAERFKVCLACGRAANAAAQPLVLDPVGVGASPWRLITSAISASCACTAVLPIMSASNIRYAFLRLPLILSIIGRSVCECVFL